MINSRKHNRTKRMKCTLMGSQDFSCSVMWLKCCREEAHLQVIREQGPRNTRAHQVLTARTWRLCLEPVQGQCSYTKVSFSFFKIFFLLSHSLLHEETGRQDWSVNIFTTRDQNYSQARASLAGHITSQMRRKQTTPEWWHTHNNFSRSPGRTRAELP